MCTAFVRKGNDLLMGFDFDLAEGAFPYRIIKNKDIFYIGITAGSTTYKTHGVNRNGNFGNLPYMNAPGAGAFRRGAAYQRLDLLGDRYVAGKLSYDELLATVKTKTLVNIPEMSMHALFADARGRILLAEPGAGYREIDAPWALITNFSVLAPPADLSPGWYGADRYRTGTEILKRSDASFSVADGLALLDAVKQTGPWATRVSFLYSANENAVYYTRDGDFSAVQKHCFG